MVNYETGLNRTSSTSTGSSIATISQPPGSCYRRVVSIGHIVHNKPCFRQLDDASFITLRSTCLESEAVSAELPHCQRHWSCLSEPANGGGSQWSVGFPGLSNPELRLTFRSDLHFVNPNLDVSPGLRVSPGLGVRPSPAASAGREPAGPATGAHSGPLGEHGAVPRLRDHQGRRRPQHRAHLHESG